MRSVTLGVARHPNKASAKGVSATHFLRKKLRDQTKRLSCFFRVTVSPYLITLTVDWHTFGPQNRARRPMQRGKKNHFNNSWKSTGRRVIEDRPHHLWFIPIIMRIVIVEFVQCQPQFEVATIRIHYGVNDLILLKRGDHGPQRGPSQVSSKQWRCQRGIWVSIIRITITGR